MVGYILAFLAVAVVLSIIAKRRKQLSEYQLPSGARELLNTNVAFYRALNDGDKAVFEGRVRDFLSRVLITGVGVEVDDLDRLLVASGAIIPIFAFPDWKYRNITEVLLYEGTFNEEFRTHGKDRNVLGMVGEGAMNREMILSKPALRSSFQHPGTGNNVAIHEFAHLIDKADGATDGVPEYLLSRPYMIPWMNLMHKTIQEMSLRGASDINLYGATNDGEFFAVVSEYFFEKPHQLQAHHPELYAMLEMMFHPGAGQTESKTT